jgi:SAM-dependent methyltransferase
LADRVRQQGRGEDQLVPPAPGPVAAPARWPGAAGRRRNHRRRRRALDAGGRPAGARFRAITALDISSEALAQSRQRLGEAAERVRWVAADVLEAELPPAAYDLWHDRAVFHFLTSAQDQAGYAARAARSVRPGGHLLLATFAPDGPEKCSGLPVCRYDTTTLASRFSPAFTPVASARESHRTPFATTQSFTYLLLRRNDNE